VNSLLVSSRAAESGQKPRFIKRVSGFAILGIGLLYLAFEEIDGMFHGMDMCWLGNGEPFNGQPCPKNFIADPLMLFFANLWVLLTDFTVYSPWGFPLFIVMIFATIIGSLTFFYLASRERSRWRGGK